MTDLSFYKGRRVLVTGHTGFKGTWLCKMLIGAGAEVLGYSRCSSRSPSVFELSGIKNELWHVKGDIRDYECLSASFQEYQPELVFHLAAQPIVRESYKDPLGTYGTNVMGTANVLECIRHTASVKSAVIVTTDKVYRNDELGRPFREDDVLDGFDPYSNSKSCAELVVNSYRRSFFDGTGIAISTARAGNVIGGGDFAKDRIIPDCVRAVQAGVPIVVRNPHSVRPYQHVLEPLTAYLLIAERQYMNHALAGSYNIGPDECDCVTTGELVDLFCRAWGEGASWVNNGEQDAPHEASFLELDCSHVKSTFGWRPRWHIDECIERTCRFYKAWLAKEDLPTKMDAEIDESLLN